MIVHTGRRGWRYCGQALCVHTCKGQGRHVSWCGVAAQAEGWGAAPCVVYAACAKRGGNRSQHEHAVAQVQTQGFGRVLAGTGWYLDLSLQFSLFIYPTCSHRGTQTLRVSWWHGMVALCRVLCICWKTDKYTCTETMGCIWQHGYIYLPLCICVFFYLNIYTWRIRRYSVLLLLCDFILVRNGCRARLPWGCTVLPY
jgi:hypothetical protein